MGRSPLNKNQTQNARYILDRAREAELSKDDAYTAAWFAFAESSLGERLKGQGTISGIYHYTQGAWEERTGRYAYDPKKPDWNSQFKDFPWEVSKDQTSAQVTVLLADLKRYRGEFDRLLDGADPETLFKGNPQGSKAWKRFTDPANDVPFTFEDYAYLRHNTSVNETKMVNGIRTDDRDGAYAAIRNEADVVYNPGYEPGPSATGPKDISDSMEGMPENMVALTDTALRDDDEDRYWGPSPGM